MPKNKKDVWQSAGQTNNQWHGSQAPSHELASWLVTLCYDFADLIYSHLCGHGSRVIDLIRIVYGDD